MGSTLKVLACKALTSGPGGTLADVSPTTASAKAWLIKNIYFYNYGSTGQDLTVDLKVKQGSTYRTLIKGITVAGGTSSSKAPTVVAREIALDLNVPDVLAVVLTPASGTPTADCVINGI